MCDEGRSLYKFVELSIQIDNVTWWCRPVCPCSTVLQPLLPILNLCNSDILILHMKNESNGYNNTCACTVVMLAKDIMPHSTSQPDFRSASSCFHSSRSISSLRILITLTIYAKIISTSTFLDLGAAVNFIFAEFAQQHKIKLTPCDSHLLWRL